MFAGIQRYMDETEMLPMAASVEIVQKLLHQGLKRPELKDELFMQLLKQSRGNPSPPAAGLLINLKRIRMQMSEQKGAQKSQQQLTMAACSTVVV